MIEIQSYIIIIIISSIIAGILGLLITLYIFPKIGLLDFPKRYGLQRSPIPYPAGLSITIIFIIIILISIFIVPYFITEFNNFDNLKIKILGFLTALLLLSSISFLDDRKQISPIIRLIIQSISALIVIFSGTFIEYITNPFSDNHLETFHISIFFSGIITFFWIIGFINATNWSDGIPNLTLSSGVFASLSLGLLSFSEFVQQPELGLLCLIFSGILIPFLFANITKTRFILGDTGSMTIGFCLAVFSLFSGGKMATLLIAMSIPIFDSIYVIFSRLLEKKSPLKGGDGKHLHDYLLRKKWNEFNIFLLYFLSSIILGTSVLFLNTIEKIAVIVCSFILFICFRKFA